MDGRGGRQERPVSHKEGAQGTLAQERGTLLRRDVLAAAHAAEDLEVQGFALLLGSERETEKEEREMYLHAREMRARGPSLLSMS